MKKTHIKIHDLKIEEDSVFGIYINDIMNTIEFRKLSDKT